MFCLAAVLQGHKRHPWALASRGGTPTRATGPVCEDQNLLGTLTHSQALAVDLVAPAGVVPQGFDAAVQVDEEGLQEGLPRVQRLHRL